MVWRHHYALSCRSTSHLLQPQSIVDDTRVRVVHLLSPKSVFQLSLGSDGFVPGPVIHTLYRQQWANNRFCRAKLAP
ncbi:hypothetical protein JAGODDHD_02308 [Sphingomonas paucimobilis]|nr:hypothetical protein [Sphingomonas paucimobilis]